MSNALAIAATTATLRNLLQAQIPNLDPTLSDLEVTTQPPDLARRGKRKAQVNLFLYQTMVNGAWRNLDMPRQVRSGEAATPPLALNLHYLITAYGRGEADDDNEAVGHRVLGSLMSVLHDHPLLGRDEIRDALPDSGLSDQFERLRITPFTMPLEEMSKLWTAFQTQYRLSVGYEVTVVLIDSRRAARAPLPVLKRGDADRGAMVVAAKAPTLRNLLPPRSQAAARLGEDVVIAGDGLSVSDSKVRFTSLRLDNSIELTPAPGNNPGELVVHLPTHAQAPDIVWVPGFYSVAMSVRHPEVPPITSNELVFALAPRISLTPLQAPPGDLTLTLTCDPPISLSQRVLLLFGDQQFGPKSPIAAPTNTVEFDVPGAIEGTYVVRLRIDGVDSIPVKYDGSPPLPIFDPEQQVTIG